MAAGRQRRFAPPHHLEENNVPDGYFLPNEADLRQVIVFPKAEWERIQDSTKEAAHTLDEKKEQEEMHLGSKAAVKDPPNATVSLAQEKLKAKQLREEKEEAKRKLLDLEEAKFREAKRKEIIDHAKTYLSYQNERMKQFHSALLFTEVLKERDAQVEFKKLKSVDNKKREREEEVRLFKEYVLREREKAQQHYMKEQAVCKCQLEQIKEHEHQADLAKLEYKREAEETERLNQLYQLEVQRRKEKEQEEKAERQRLYHEYVADQKIIKAIEEQKQMEEDDRIKAHFKAKETIAQMRKKKEAEMRRKAQEHQDRMVTQLSKQLSEALKMEDDRLARDIAKQEAEEENKRKEKEARQKAAIESIAEYRATVMKMQMEKKRQEKEEAEKELKVLMEKDRIYHEMEKAKKQGRYGANVKVQKIQIQQMAEKQAKQQQEKQADLDYEAQNEAIALGKEREFQSYAKQVIESESKTTHRLYPLLKACKDGRGLGHGPFF
ncbi:Coiled-coil domain-containing protein 173 [Willisornis vidua]|uniref:Coiled-coil domain-containing protein 173 n=1 Tax=Willisornis vidua TaxID=1566151 RepID=A0ABQ9D5P7_9PASS|nr:Coiled-coil domain-containing protein 173 [Willisornis vidua]